MNKNLAFGRDKKIIILVFVVLIEILLSNNTFAQTTIEVFVDQPVIMPMIPNADITIFDISRAELLQKNTPKFSPDLATAKSQATTWLASSEGKAHIAQLKEAYIAHQKMMAYGIQKIPAIVFERGNFVIYGSTDIKQAVVDYDQFIRANKHTDGRQHE
jgi:integrating conjugative element protein (TIGR03757 family)